MNNTMESTPTVVEFSRRKGKVDTECLKFLKKEKVINAQVQIVLSLYLESSFENGYVLDIKEFADRHGVTQTEVRDAINYLGKKGIIGSDTPQQLTLDFYV